ncbi:MAG TPA: glucoamylase family protein [Candidatus Acidoferrales bacterium]|nr:glucoamylase family protein [Candidatus Acidoferrales bacterium]
MNVRAALALLALSAFAPGASAASSAPTRGATVTPRPAVSEADSSAHFTYASLRPADRAFVDTLEARTFHYFWDLTDPRTGLTPDRAPTRSFSSVAAVGFALTAYPIGAERGWITRQQALERTRATLRFFWTSRQDTARAGATGYRGFYYHFLNPHDGTRFQDVELSSIDTALLLAGALFSEQYFDRASAGEAEVRALAESLYRRVDWSWMSVRPPKIALGWEPEDGPLPYDAGGYDETAIMYLLALGSPTHPLGATTWEQRTKDYTWAAFEGESQVNFGPLFGHQYSHAWVDFRGITDAWMRAKGIDYFENSRRATLAQRRYASVNPGRFDDYGPLVWGLTACDGPLDGRVEIGGRSRAFHTYTARGACANGIVDDGTIAPAAVAGSMPFVPELVLPTLEHLATAYGRDLDSTYGFLDAFNPTLKGGADVHHGRIVPGKGWFDTDWLGIDEGPILLMIENWRSGLVWSRMRRCPHLVHGLEVAGFEGGWLERARTTR